MYFLFSFQSYKKRRVTTKQIQKKQKNDLDLPEVSFVTTVALVHSPPDYPAKKSNEIDVNSSKINTGDTEQQLKKKTLQKSEMNNNMVISVPLERLVEKDSEKRNYKVMITEPANQIGPSRKR